MSNWLLGLPGLFGFVGSPSWGAACDGPAEQTYTFGEELPHDRPLDSA